jgi:NADPH:quinone reductase-like Zn-dependent oxidoreductase
MHTLINCSQADNTTIDIKDGTGPISSLFMNEETPKPKPSASQALVRIHCFGLNRMDLMQREGKYNVPPQAGKILGVEFSGVIEELGDGDVADFHVGDEVFGLAYGGKEARCWIWLVASDIQFR